MTEPKYTIKKIEISDNDEFFKEKEFVWDDIPDFAVITGINGSGKTKLLEWIFYNREGLSAINIIYPPLNGNDILYKKANGKLKTKRSILPTVYDMVQTFENNYMNYIEETKNLNELNKRALLWQSQPIRNWFSSYFTKVGYLFGHLKNTDLDKLVNNFTDKKDFIKLLEDERKNQERSIIDIISRIGKIIRDDRFDVNEEFDKNERMDKYFFSKINKILEEIKDDNEKQLFKHKIRAPNNEETKDDKYQLTFEDEQGDEIKFEGLSSGEQVIFELLCYQYLLSDDNENKGCQPKIVLLDEFDAHLNPVLAKIFIDVIEKYFVKNGIQVIMTTHSPSTVAYVPEEKLFWMEDGKILGGKDRKDKMYIVHKLATGFIKEKESCPFISYLIDPRKPYYILVEGYTDMLHLKIACKKLGGYYESNILNKCNFIILGGTKGINTKAFIKNFAEKRKTINIFDYDTSGKKLFDEIFTKPYNNNTKRYIKQIDENSKDNIGILLASENTTDYKKQIEGGYITIELMYSKSTITECKPGLLKAVETKAILMNHYKNGGNIKLEPSDSYFIVTNEKDDKLEFANAVKDFASDDFEGFKPTLDLVLKVIEKWEEKKVE